LGCQKTFSQASFDPFCWHKKRAVHGEILTGLASLQSQRRLAFLLHINRKTVVRKFRILGGLAGDYLKQQNANHDKVACLQFDDLETFEHTNCKPVSVLLVVEQRSRRILGFKCAQMPAKGLLAKISRKKYGKRPDERKIKRQELFSELSPFIEKTAQIHSDQNPHYASDVLKFFPHCVYKTYKGRKATVAGQGELKKGGFDPLFSLNHTCAMLRANINRLIRKTWCTTKKTENLTLHLNLYAIFHNEMIEFNGKRERQVRPLIFMIENRSCC